MEFTKLTGDIYTCAGNELQKFTFTNYNDVLVTINGKTTRISGDCKKMIDDGDSVELQYKNKQIRVSGDSIMIL